MSDTTIPADAIAGLLGDWLGPVLGPDGRTHVRIGAWTPRFPGDSVIVVADGPGAMSDDGAEVGAAPASALRLDCLRPEVQARVGRVLAAGVGCECARLDEAQPDNPRSGVVDPYCPDCKGSGWTRKPSPIHHILDSARTNALSPQHIAEAVAYCVRNVARGGEVLRGVVGPYYDAIDNGWGRVDIVGAGVSVGVCPAVRENGEGWYVIFHGTDDTPDINVSGPETGPEGRAKADDALREYNIGFIDGGALVLPGELE